ncbi:AAA family ATPase [candidate division KSB1 bacterium]|nr:AAA family ATPase [candidate division KSB1 bacterium]
MTNNNGDSETVTLSHTKGDSRLKIDKEIELLIRAKYPIISLLSWEEDRITRQLKQMAAELDIENVRTWSFSRGFDDEDLSLGPPKDPISALDDCLKDEQDGVFIFYDFHPFLRDHASRSLFNRKLRDLAIAFRESPLLRTIILISPIADIPDELEKDVTLIDYPLPEVGEIDDIFEETIKTTGAKSLLSPSDKEKLLKAALGLTVNEIRNVFAKAVVDNNQIQAEDIQFIIEEKRQIIRKSGILEYYPLEEEFDSIGGLNALKEWLRQRSNSFSYKAREFGLPEPKGILLVGIPGCGKSLSAKAVAAEWKQPLLRLDIGKIFGGIVGSSEENMRRAIKVAESVSPTILWLDEIEKGFAGMKDGGDSGVTSRVFGTFLTWMQEKNKPVFVVATANDISKLPPEFLRKGRFDEIFFVDLPEPDEIKEIIAIHLQKRNRDPEDFDLEMLAKIAKGYTGAEIEQIIISSLYTAFHTNKDIDTAMIETAIQETVPLSKTMETEITALRRWAQKRARFASEVRTTGSDQMKPPIKPLTKLRFPYMFDNQQKANTFSEFKELCKENESEVWENISAGRMEKWLERNNFFELAAETAKLRDYTNNDIAFEQFLALLEKVS